MNIELPNDIKIDIIRVAEGLGPIQIVEGLEELIIRDKFLLMNSELLPEVKEIVIHGLAILTAAVYGYKQSVTEFNKKVDEATIKIQDP